MWKCGMCLWFLTWILKSHQRQTELSSLRYSNNIISKWGKGITPCLVNILNDTAVSMACSSEPSIEEVRKIIYQHMCHPRHIRAVSVVCYSFKNSIGVIAMEMKKEDHIDCWCGEVHFKSLNGWSKLSNLNIFTKPTCDMTQITLHTLLPTSFQLFGLNVSNINFNRLRLASIIVLHDSLTTSPSLLDLVRLHSLRLISLSHEHFASILQDWEQDSMVIPKSHSTDQTCVIELLDLEIIRSNISQIPDRIFTVICVKVTLSLSFNIIRIISEDAFVGLTTLRALYLNNNKIVHIHKAAFKPLTNLNNIQLQENQIQTLDTNMFINMNADLPFSSGNMLRLYILYQASGDESITNITIVKNKLLDTVKLSTAINNYLFSSFNYLGYVKHLYINNEHDIRDSFIDIDYDRVHIMFLMQTALSSFLQVNLYGNPLVHSQHPCFYVSAEEVSTLLCIKDIPVMPCFCNIGDSVRESIRDSTQQDIIDNDDVESPTYINETKCETGNKQTPGIIVLKNITTISVLQFYHKTLVTSTVIRISLSSNNIKVLEPSNTWLPHQWPHHTDTNLSKTLHVDTLMLNDNGLTNILPGAWLNLTFTFIDLDNNNLMNISDWTFQNLDTESLSIQYNNIKYTSKMGFKNIKSLILLQLSDNMIHQLGFKPFPPTLITLRLRNNNLTKIHFQYEYIITVDFSLNHLTFLHQITNRSHINSSYLLFQDNMITYIEENTFQCYASIDHFDLSRNYFDLNFTKIYFDRNFQCGLLNLSNNHITSVRNLFYHAGFRRIIELDLSHNYITEATYINNHHHHTTLIKLHMAYNKITYISPNIFQNMVNLIYADFKANRLHYIHTMLAISPDLVVDITQNLLHCSCQLRWLSKGELWHKYKTDFCKDLVSLKQVRVIDVPLEDFVCETPCTTDQCDCYGTHINQSSVTTHVTCRGRGLTDVPHPLPPLILVLDISHNYIQYLNTFTFTRYSHLKKIILSHNAILSLTLSYFNALTNLKILMLNHNQIRYVSFNQVLNMTCLEELYLNNNNIKIIELNGQLSNMLPSLQRVDISYNKLPYINRSLCHDLTKLTKLHSLKLHGNDWECVSCNAQYFRLCVSNNYKLYAKVSDMWKWTCTSGNSSVPLLSFAWSNDVCKEKTKTFSTKHIVFIVINVIFVIVAVFMCPCSVFRIRYAKYFRVIFQHLSVVFHRDKTRHPLPQDQYDANLVYDSEDEQVRHWVVQILLQGLEQDHGYKIMIEERDGPVGCPIAEANYLAIRDSQRTIVVLSQHFHHDKWKQDAVDQAFLCWKNHNKKHKLIFVAYDRLLESEELVNELKALVHAGNYCPCLYIDRHDKWFWKTLRHEMPKHSSRCLH